MVAELRLGSKPENGILSDHLPLRVVLTGKPSQRAGKRRQGANTVPPKEPVENGDEPASDAGAKAKKNRRRQHAVAIQALMGLVLKSLTQTS